MLGPGGAGPKARRPPPPRRPAPHPLGAAAHASTRPPEPGAPASSAAAIPGDLDSHVRPPFEIQRVRRPSAPPVVRTLWTIVVISARRGAARSYASITSG